MLGAKWIFNLAIQDQPAGNWRKTIERQLTIMQLNGAHGGVSIACHIYLRMGCASDRAAPVQANHELLGTGRVLFVQFLNLWIAGLEKGFSRVTFPVTPPP